MFSNVFIGTFFHHELNFLLNPRCALSHMVIFPDIAHRILYELYCAGELLRFLHQTILGTPAYTTFYNSKFLASILFDAL